MKNRRWLPIVLLSLTSVVLFPVQAWACACCSDEGEYRISFRKPGASELGLLRDMRFGAKANFIETPAGDAAGQAPTDAYSLTASLSGSIWKLAFSDGNKSGTLNLPLPPKMLSYAVDTHDGKTSPGGGPLLYKEWRFEGRATGMGVFQNASTTYFLVLQGRGNRCDNAEDFSHWRLEVKSPKARYAFYGELVRSNAAASNR